MDSELSAWRVEAGRFADVRLMAELQQLARVDRRSEARILVLLAEVDERELFLAQGYSSLFRYAVCVLRMSEAQAYLRIGAARVARSYPSVLEMLLEGALNLSTVKLLAPQLTAENHGTLLERARDKTKREVELLIAEAAPKPDVQTRIRKMPARAARTGSAQAELVMSAATGVQGPSDGAGVAMATAPATIATPIATAALATHAAATAHAECDPPVAGVVVNATIATTVAAAELAPRTAAVENAASEPHTAAAIAPATTDAARVAPAAAAPHSTTASSSSAVAAVAPRAAAAFALASPRASCAALSPGRYKLELTVDQALFDQLMTLKHLLKHRVPSGDLGAILELAIKGFSEKLCKQRFAELSKPASGARAQASRKKAPDAPMACASQNEAPTSGFSQREGKAEHGAEKVKRRSRYVQREVVREVFGRDGAQCTFVSTDGKRCAERGMLELHHIKAFAHGGAPTPENLKVVCRSHNSFFATQDFGAAHMRTMRVRAR